MILVVEKTTNGHKKMDIKKNQHSCVNVADIKLNHVSSFYTFNMIIKIQVKRQTACLLVIQYSVIIVKNLKDLT